jgi:hypothetical protein
MTYYCSKESQEKAWKKGHKQACQKPDEIHPRVIKEAPEAGRWKVEDPGFSERCLSIATKNLQHIWLQK